MYSDLVKTQRNIIFYQMQLKKLEAEMEKINDGGPVHPTQQLAGTYATSPLKVGMTLREYFATHAPEIPSWFLAINAVDLEENFFKWRWYYADQMIKTRGEA